MHQVDNKIRAGPTLSSLAELEEQNPTRLASGIVFEAARHLNTWFGITALIWYPIQNHLEEGDEDNEDF